MCRLCPRLKEVSKKDVRQSAHLIRASASFLDERFMPCSISHSNCPSSNRSCESWVNVALPSQNTFLRPSGTLNASLALSVSSQYFNHSQHFCPSWISSPRGY